MGHYADIGSKGIIGLILQELKAAEQFDWSRQVSLAVTSDQEIETYKWLGRVPQMRVKAGSRLAKKLRVNTWPVTNEEYEATLNFKIQDMRRDKIGQIRARIQGLARRAQYHWIKLITDLVIAGDATAAYDGQYFFDTDHDEGSSGTLKNLLTSSEVGTLDITTATAPTADEAAKAVLGVVEYMGTWLDDQGEPIEEDIPGDYIVFAPAGPIASAFREAVASKRLDTGSGSRDNILEEAGINLDVRSSARLTGNTAGSQALNVCFFVFKKNAIHAPFIRQEEVPLMVKALAEGSDLEYNEDEHSFSVEATRAAAYALWQGASMSVFS